MSNVPHSLAGEIEHRIEEERTVEPHQASVLAGVCRIQADRDSIKEPGKFRQDVALVDHIAVAVGIQAGASAVVLHPPGDLLEGVQPYRRLPITAEHHFLIPARIPDLGYDLFRLRLLLDPEIDSFDHCFSLSVAEDAVRVASYREVYVDGIPQGIGKPGSAEFPDAKQLEGGIVGPPSHIVG